MTKTFRKMPGFTTTDGHRYTSVPVEVPDVWYPWYDEKGFLHYGSGPYEIRREPYLQRFTYRLFRDVDGRAVELHFSCSSLREAKAYASRNARGEHVVNWA